MSNATVVGHMLDIVSGLVAPGPLLSHRAAQLALFIRPLFPPHKLECPSRFAPLIQVSPRPTIRSLYHAWPPL